MFTADARNQARLAALAERVLIVDALPASAKLLSDLLRAICHCQIWTAADVDQGLAAGARIQPSLIFISQADGLDGADFTRKLRRSDLSCRKAAVVLISAEATAAAIIAARDAGVHEFLRKPFTIRDLARRLEAMAARPREWVEAVAYIGPERRRFNAGNYSGQLRRRVDHAVTPADARLGQALKILKAALDVIEIDPRQALRAMAAQAGEVEAVAKLQGDAALGEAAAALCERLAGLDALTLRRAVVAPLAEPLLARLAPEPPAIQRPAA